MSCHLAFAAILSATLLGLAVWDFWKEGMEIIHVRDTPPVQSRNASGAVTLSESTTNGSTAIDGVGWFAPGLPTSVRHQRRTLSEGDGTLRLINHKISAPRVHRGRFSEGVGIDHGCEYFSRGGAGARLL